jgi:hypothetical protein
VNKQLIRNTLVEVNLETKSIVCEGKTVRNLKSKIAVRLIKYFLPLNLIWPLFCKGGLAATLS